MDLVKLEPLLKEKLNSLGYTLSSIKFNRNKDNRVLSIVVDRIKDIDMDAIVELSGILSAYLDEINEDEESYVLDVSSLGAEKPLNVTDLGNYVSRYVHVHLINPIDGENIYEGDIKEVKDDSFILTIKVKSRVKDLVILFNNINKIRLAIKF